MGCSNSSQVISWDNGVISVKGVTYNVDEFSGYEATVKSNSYDIKIFECGPIMDCLHNSQGIPEENMTDYKNGVKYYSAYLGTQFRMYIPNGKEKHTEVECMVSDVGVMSSNQVVDTMYSTAKDIAFSLDYKKVKCNDVLELSVEGYDYRVRPSGVVIPGLIKVAIDPGTRTMTESVTVGETTLGKTSTDSYDYYQYKGLMIQAAKGTDISSLITFIGD